MSRRVRLAVLAVLTVAVAWTTLTVVNAVTRGEGDGGVFWSAVGLIAVLDVGLILMTIRVARRRSDL